MKMAAQENVIKELKSVLNTDKIVIGTEETIKELKGQMLSKVYLSSNVPEKVAEDIAYYCDLAGTEIVRLEVPNEELGVMCQKPYYISVLGIKK